MASIVGMVLELELEEHEDLKSGQLGKTLASFAAVEIERKIGRGKTTLRDVLSRVVSDFNKMTTKKAHRIDSSRKALIYNLLLTSI